MLMYRLLAIAVLLAAAVSPPGLEWQMRAVARHDNDRNALFVLTLTSGLRADYAGAAERGHYFGPFVGILPAIAYIREKSSRNRPAGCWQLQREFPQNPLFVRELAKLDQKER